MTTEYKSGQIVLMDSNMGGVFSVKLTHKTTVDGKIYWHGKIQKNKGSDFHNKDWGAFEREIKGVTK